MRRDIKATDPDWCFVRDTWIWGKLYVWLRHTPTGRLVLLGAAS
jgi:hypothetical protein